jgi:hypothetical protein
LAFGNIKVLRMSSLITAFLNNETPVGRQR